MPASRRILLMMIRTVRESSLTSARMYSSPFVKASPRLKRKQRALPFAYASGSDSLKPNLHLLASVDQLEQITRSKVALHRLGGDFTDVQRSRLQLLFQLRRDQVSQILGGCCFEGQLHACASVFHDAHAQGLAPHP